jgi:hypothetical protein
MGFADECRARVAGIAKDYARQSFFKLCRLLWLFDKFQFEESNTYLTTTDGAGRSCRQLYNAFVTTLPVSEDFKQTRLDTLAILASMHGSVQVPGRDKPVAGATLTEAEFNTMVDCVDDAALRNARVAFGEWLAGRPDQVYIAAQSLRAYSELLSHELANLYRDWFRRTPLSDQTYAELVAYREWPDVLTPDSVRAIRRALSAGELLQPPGRAYEPTFAKDRAVARATGDQTRPPSPTPEQGS